MSDQSTADDRDTTIARIRESAAIRVQATSLREAAREIGMTPMGLRNFLQGAAPHSPTLRRLRLWYVRRAAVTGGTVRVEDASAAISILVHDMAPAARLAVTSRVLDAVALGYEQMGRASPAWLPELRARFSERRDPELPSSVETRPSAMGKYAHLPWSSEEYARRKQDEIDLEDGRVA